MTFFTEVKFRNLNRRIQERLEHCLDDDSGFVASLYQVLIDTMESSFDKYDDVLLHLSDHLEQFEQDMETSTRTTRIGMENPESAGNADGAPQVHETETIQERASILEQQFKHNLLFKVEVHHQVLALCVEPLEQEPMM